MIVVVYKNCSFGCYDNTTERRRWVESQNQHEMQNAGNKTALPEPFEGQLERTNDKLTSLTWGS